MGLAVWSIYMDVIVNMFVYKSVAFVSVHVSFVQMLLSSASQRAVIVHRDSIDLHSGHNNHNKGHNISGKYKTRIFQRKFKLCWRRECDEEVERTRLRVICLSKSTNSVEFQYLNIGLNLVVFVLLVTVVCKSTNKASLSRTDLQFQIWGCTAAPKGSYTIVCNNWI